MCLKSLQKFPSFFYIILNAIRNFSSFIYIYVKFLKIYIIIH